MVARLRHIQALSWRVEMLCSTREQVQLFYTKGFFSTTLGILEQGILNAAKVECATDLMEATILTDSQARMHTKHTRRDQSV